MTPDVLALLLDNPPAYVWQVKRRKRQKDRQSRSRRNAALFVGAIVILTDERGDPYECEVTHQSQDGTWWCVPLQP